MASFGDHCDPALLLIARTARGFDMETFKDNDALFLAAVRRGVLLPAEKRARLKSLDEAADALREELGLSRRGDVVSWFLCQRGGERTYEVVADGYGKFVLVVTEGSNPNDRLTLEQASYADEDRAVAAARRLAEEGVAWEDRDTPTDGDAADGEAVVDAFDRWPCGELKDGGPEDAMGCPIHGEDCPDDDEDDDESEDDDG